MQTVTVSGKNLKRLDFGSGFKPKSGYAKCDMTYSPDLDYVYDGERISAEDGIFKVIRCRNVLHHVKDIKALLVEFYRVLQDDGILLIIEANKEAYTYNVILDVIWYHFLLKQYDMWFSTEYRDYVVMAQNNGFGLLKKTNVLEKEIAVFVKKKT